MLFFYTVRYKSLPMAGFDPLGRSYTKYMNLDWSLMEYELIRSKRKTLAVQIKSDGSVIVRAPLRCPKRDIDMFLLEKKAWIEAHRAKMIKKQEQEKANPIPSLTDAQLRDLKKRAAVAIPEQVVHFAPLVGVTYGRISIRSQKTRWGSCSAKGNLNFNCLLLLAPPEVLDYVVVHELCHRKYMNHSPRFWAEVARVMPDYKIRKKWLRDNGNRLMKLLRE